MSPKFSIIIPVYNVATYLCECLNSVLAQTFTEWEAICVDDGSTDGSGTILDEYAVKDKRFRVIHQANAGVSAARNTALDVVQGDWIGFLDADDVLLPGRLMNIADVIAKNDEVDVVRTGWINWIGQERVPRSQCGADSILFARGEQSTINLWSVISRCSFPFVMYYKRGVCDNLRYVLGVRFREDALFQYSLAQNGGGLVMVPENGYLHRERDGSATFQARHREDSYRLLDEYLPIWKRLPRGRVRGMCRAASTFWVSKDVNEWFRFCPMRKFQDSFRVWVSVWRLTICGAFAPFSEGTAFDGLRRLVYLVTGFGNVLSFTRLSFKRGGKRGC